MPVRLIPKNYRSLTGVIASKKTDRGVGYESGLERDLVTLLEFEPRIVDFEEQPLQMAFMGTTGRPRVYTPDFLVSYRPNDLPDEPIQKCVVEVKYRRDLWDHWAELRPVFKAARAHAAAGGWHFRILTEVEIRKPWFKAIKFLSAYLHLPADPVLEEWIVKELSRSGARYVKDLRYAAGPEIWQEGRLLTQLWRLVATGSLRINYHKPMNSNQTVALNEEAAPLYLPLKLPGMGG